MNFFVENNGITYTVFESIGKGSNSIVYRCSDGTDEYAIKIMLNQNYNEDEIKNHLDLNHNGIIKIISYFKTIDKTFIVMELFGSSLYNKIYPKVLFTQDQIYHIIKQILDVLKYLSDNLIIHNDIKLENFLVDESDQIKLCDFGYSIKLKNKDDTVFNTKGTLDYFSPEMVRLSKTGIEKDIWSTGILFFELFKGQTPFSDELKVILTFKKIVNFDISKHSFDNEFESTLLNLMLHKNRSKFITIDEIIELI